MDRRRAYRRNRRNRKTRCRKPRFSNRGNSIKKDRLNPTMISKINSHIREIEFIKSILPVSTLVLETGTFGPHLLKIQEEGKPFNRSWGYQKGPNYGFGNAKAACLNKDNYTCQCCKIKKGTLHAALNMIILGVSCATEHSASKNKIVRFFEEGLKTLVLEEELTEAVALALVTSIKQQASLSAKQEDVSSLAAHQFTT